MTIGKLFYLVGALMLLNANQSARAYSDEEVVGRSAAAQVLGAAKLVPTEKIQNYLNLCGHTLLTQVQSPYKWHFGLIDTDSVNAFAMPGGYILITSGLLQLIETEDELAFVLAHEISHVTRQHHYNVVKRQRLAEQANRQLISVRGEDGDTAKLSVASAQIYSRGLDKGAEFESDRLGVELAARAGYDPSAALSVLERLAKISSGDPRGELLFSTHPSPRERLDMLLQSGIDRLTRPGESALSARRNRFKSVLRLK